MLGIPHEATEDISVDGYFFPKGLYIIYTFIAASRCNGNRETTLVIL